MSARATSRYAGEDGEESEPAQASRHDRRPGWRSAARAMTGTAADVAGGAGANPVAPAAHGHRLNLPDRAPALARRRSRRLGLAVGVNAAVTVLELAGGWLAHSVALLADAGHNAADIAAAVIALAAVRIARRPPDASKSFGYHRSGVLAAEVNAGAVLVVSVLVAVGAVVRLAHPVAARGSVMVAVAGAALVLNAFAALALSERHGELNTRAVALHLGADAAASAGVLVAGVALLLDEGLRWLDPAVSLAIALMVAWQAVRLGRQVADVLLESTPPGTDTERLAAVVLATPGVEDVHDLHVWALSSEVTLLSAHLVMAGHPTLEGAQDVAGSVRGRLVRDFGIAHATFELECETCAPAP